MSVEIQLEMFSEQDDFSLLLKEINVVKSECANVRRGIFSRFDVVKKDVMDIVKKQQEEIELLKSMIQMKNHSQEIITMKVSHGKNNVDFDSYPKLLCAC